MKTKELIALLHNLDPTGETEVVVDDKGVYSVTAEDAALTGPYCRLEKDGCRKPLFSVVGITLESSGPKIRIRPVGVEDFLEEVPDGEINLAKLDSEQKSIYRDRIKNARDKSKK